MIWVLIVLSHGYTLIEKPQTLTACLVEARVERERNLGAIAWCEAKLPDGRHVIISKEESEQA